MSAQQSCKMKDEGYRLALLVVNHPESLDLSDHNTHLQLLTLPETYLLDCIFLYSEGVYVLEQFALFKEKVNNYFLANNSPFLVAEKPISQEKYFGDAYHSKIWYCETAALARNIYCDKIAKKNFEKSSLAHFVNLAKERIIITI